MPTRYGYTGREYDEYTGLMYYRARFYDPQIGRFISEDPIEFEGGINWYAYVDNDPINFIDPYGFDKFKLPDHPSKLLPEWKPDPTHKNPNGQRFRHPNGDFLDFHPKNPNKSPKTHGGNDHWHHNGDKKHLYPEDEIELKPDVCEEAPAPDPMPFTPLAPPPPNWLPWWLRFPLPSFPLLPIMINPCIVDPHFPGCPLENLA
jgi:RHS repeat-associated protein